MKILFLEPHGDDSLLSAHSILATDNEISILTFADFRSSEGLKEFFPSVKYTEYIDVPNLWFSDGKPVMKTHDIHRGFVNNEPIYANYLQAIREEFRDRLPDTVDRLEKIIRDHLSKNSYDVVVCPSAVVHPFHIAVREAWSRIDSIPTIYYADKHYINNRYGKELFEDFKKSYGFDKEVNPGYVRFEEERKDISDILWKVYPSEGKLMRFYGDIIVWYPCKYVYNSNETIERLVGELNG